METTATILVCSEASYGSHSNTHRLTDPGSHRGSKHLLAVTSGHNGGINHNTSGCLNGLVGEPEEEVGEDGLDVNQVDKTLFESRRQAIYYQ